MALRVSSTLRTTTSAGEFITIEVNQSGISFQPHDKKRIVIKNTLSDLKSIVQKLYPAEDRVSVLELIFATVDNETKLKLFA